MKRHNHIQPAELALQAGSMPMNDSRFFAGSLLDGFSPLKNAQIWLLESSRGICSLLVPLNTPLIHNYQLSVLLPEKLGTIPKVVETNVLEPAAIKAGCSGTPTELRQKRCGCFPRSGEGSRRSGRNEVESFDRARYNPTQKTRVAYTNVAQYTPPSFSAPTSYLPCQNLPSQRAITNEWSGRPLCSRSQAARTLLRGAKVVTRTALSASLEREVC